MIRRELLERVAGWVFRGARGIFGEAVPLAAGPEKNGARGGAAHGGARAGGGVSTTRPLRHGLAYLGTFLESPPGREGELGEGVRAALRKWGRQGKSGVEACGHSALGLRSRLALLQRESAFLKAPLLDLACGNGAFTRLLPSVKNGERDGIDLDEVFLAEAKPFYRHLSLGDLRHGLPAGLPGPYRTLLCLEVLQYLSWPEVTKLLVEARSRAEPGASLYCLFPHRGSVWHRARYLLGLGPEDYLASHDASLVAAAAMEAGWRLASALTCGYGSTEVRELKALPEAGYAQAHMLLRFEV